MIVLRNNASRLKEKDFAGEGKLIRRYLPEAANTIGKGQIQTEGVIRRGKNYIVSPLKKLGIGMKGKLEGKTKDQILRDKVAYDVKRARKGGIKGGWKTEDLLGRIHAVNINTAPSTRKSRIKYPNDIELRYHRKGIQELADTAGMEKEMESIVKHSKNRARRRADHRAEELVTSLAPQF